MTDTSLQRDQGLPRIRLWDIIRSIAPWSIKIKKLVDHVAGGAVCLFLRPLSTHTNVPEKIRKLLIIRPGGMGDAVLLLPVIRAAYGHNPEMEITVLCERRNADVFRSQTDLPLIVLDYEKTEHRRTVVSQSFDAVVDTEQWHYISALMARFAPATVKVGFGTRPGRVKCFSHVVPYAMDGYELDNFTALVRPLNLFPERTLALEGSFRVSEDARQSVHKYHVENGVAVFLGGSIKLRQLTVEQAVAIGEAVLEKGRDLILLGGKDACVTAAEVTARFPQGQIHNLTGILTLAESAAVMEKSKAFIGTDSGLLHIAAALNVPLLGIFGPGSWEKWAPRHASARIVKTQSRWNTYFGYTLPQRGESVRMNDKDYGDAVRQWMTDKGMAV